MLERGMGTALMFGAVSLVAASCSNGAAPTSPGSVASAPAVIQRAAAGNGTHVHTEGPPGQEGKGYIDGWLNGGDVQLYYTKLFSCNEPPDSGAPSNCEIGAPGQEPPRPGRIPTIYAIAAIGFTPPPGTAACLAGSTCLNHPAMIDLSRIGGPPSAPPASHSHILSAPGGGWFNTVNIRVFSLAAWNEIAQAKSLAKVRELQGPGGATPGVISGDTATNIYFFIAGARPN